MSPFSGAVARSGEGPEGDELWREGLAVVCRGRVVGGRVATSGGPDSRVVAPSETRCMLSPFGAPQRPASRA